MAGALPKHEPIDYAKFSAVLDEMVETDDVQYRFHCPHCGKLIVVDKPPKECPKCGGGLGDFELSQKRKLHSSDNNTTRAKFTDRGTKRGEIGENHTMPDDGT